MLSPDMTEGLRLIGEAILVVWGVVTGKREIQRRKKKAPLSIADDEEDDAEAPDRRSGVRRSELLALIRKVDDLVEQVRTLVDTVADHENRIDEGARAHRAIVTGLGDLTKAVNDLRRQIEDRP